MARDLIFNLLSLKPNDAYDPYQARQWAVRLGELFKEAQEVQRIAIIRFDEEIQSRNIMKDYPFQKWLNSDVPQPLRILIRSWTVNKGRVRIPTWIGLRNLEIAADARYYFDNKAWGLAFVRDHILVSFASHDDWDCELLGCDYIDMEIDVDNLKTGYIRHSSLIDHLRQHRRIYYCHPKHCHELPFTGVRDTKMDLSEIEAQNVLNQAVQAPQNRQLYGYSKRTQKLYEFKPETPPAQRPWLNVQNKFHGYPVEPREVHADIGGNAYNEIILELRISGQLDDLALRNFEIH